MSQPGGDRPDRDDLSEPPGAPGSVPREGSGWWQKSVAAAPSSVSRRAALQGILAAGGVLAGLAAAPPEAAAQDPELRTEARRSLDMQKLYGWSFGAATEALTFDGATQKPFDRTALARMPEDLRPSRLRHQPFYVPTLFQAPTALPRAVPAGDAAPIVPLRDALRPIFTPAMDASYRRGQALASLFRYVYTRAAVVVDLPGPEAVAFAAGAAEVLDPVFLFDNWPHPRGVVPSHLTLAAAAYYQPLFARHASPAGAPPMFVLDRHRLAPYTDDDTEFDNRYVARVPSAEALRAMDVAHVLYITPSTLDVLELDDLNDDFIAYAAAGVDVKLAGADAFGPDPSMLIPDPFAGEVVVDGVSAEERRRYYYGHHRETHASFWVDYGWVHPVPHAAGTTPRTPAFPRPGMSFHPGPRATPHSATLGSPSNVKTVPPLFGHVHVVIAARTGTVLGAASSRSGSWGRATSSATGG